MRTAKGDKFRMVAEFFVVTPVGVVDGLVPVLAPVIVLALADVAAATALRVEETTGDVWI